MIRHIRTFSYLRCLVRRCSHPRNSSSSSLYARDNTVVRPLIDVEGIIRRGEDRWGDIMKRRGLPPISVAEIEKLWAEMVEINAEAGAIAPRLNKLIGTEREESEEWRELMDMWSHWDNKWKEVEERIVERVRSLPNYIHIDVPQQDAVVTNKKVKENGEDKVKVGERKGMGGELRNHVDIGLSEGTLKRFHRSNFYCKRGKLAELEQSIEWWLYDEILSLGFSALSPPDTYTSSLLEAAHDLWNSPEHVLTLERPAGLHLTGVSLHSFTAHLTLTRLHQHLLPLAYYAIGTSYSPSTTTPNTICSSHQTKVADAFIVDLVRDDRAIDGLLRLDEDDGYQRLLSLYQHVYDRLGVDYRVVNVGVRRLKPVDQLRTSIEIWSELKGGFVECGHISIHGDHLTNKLRMQCLDHQLVTYYTRVVDISVLLTCLIETWQTTTPPAGDIPQALQPYLIS